MTDVIGRQLVARSLSICYGLTVVALSLAAFPLITGDLEGFVPFALGHLQGRAVDGVARDVRFNGDARRRQAGQRVPDDDETGMTVSAESYGAPWLAFTSSTSTATARAEGRGVAAGKCVVGSAVAATVTAPATVVSPTSTAAAGDTGGEAKGRNSFHGYSRAPVPIETLTPEDVLPRPLGSPAAGGEVRFPALSTRMAVGSVHDGRACLTSPGRPASARTSRPTCPVLGLSRGVATGSAATTARNRDDAANAGVTAVVARLIQPTAITAGADDDLVRRAWFHLEIADEDSASTSAATRKGMPSGTSAASATANGEEFNRGAPEFR